MGLSDRVALVVGGGGGIGTAIVERLCDEGCHVVLTSRRQSEVETVATSISGPTSIAEGHELDVTDEGAVKSLVAGVVNRLGRIDIAVNCAGVSYISPVLLGKLERWDEVVRVNLLGAFIVSRAVLRPMLRARYGRIIHIGSISSQVGASYNAIYAASKAGVDGLVRSLALEVAASGITVNAVAPGYVRTKLFRETQGARAKLKGVTIEEHEQDLVDDTPTRRLVEPADVAAAVAYLASDAAASVTGQVLNVDGGRTAS